jgi:SSS family solute:Na+ symporter
MLATIMSSLNTLAFVSAATIGRDIVWRLNNANESRIPHYTRIGLVLTAILSVALSLTIPSVIKLWYTIGTVIVPGLLVPLVSSYFDRTRISARFGFVAMLSLLTSTVWLLLDGRRASAGRTCIHLVLNHVPGGRVSGCLRSAEF